MLLVTSKSPGWGKQKPRQFGPLSQVERSVFINAEMLGIPPDTLVYLAGMQGGAGDYHNIIDGTTAAPSSWTNNGAYFDLTESQTQTVANIGTSDFTILVKFSDKSIYGDTYPTFISSGDTGAGEWMLRHATAGGTPSFYADSGGINLASSVTGTGISDGILSASRGDDSIARLWSDGVELTTDVTVADNLNTTKPISLGGADGATNRRLLGGIDFALVMRHADINVLQFLHDAPYALLQPVPQVSYFFMGAVATVPTLSAASFTGRVPSVTLGF